MADKTITVTEPALTVPGLVLRVEIYRRADGTKDHRIVMEYPGAPTSIDPVTWGGLGDPAIPAPLRTRAQAFFQEAIDQAKTEQRGFWKP